MQRVQILWVQLSWWVMDRLRSFLGKRPVAVGTLKLYSPTIDQIDEIGEGMYHVYLNLAMFEKETVFKQLFKATDDEYSQIEDMDDYDALTTSRVTGDYIASAISFFARKEIGFDAEDRVFLSDGEMVIDKNGYGEVVKIVKVLNGIEEKEEDKIKFKSDRAKEKYKRLLKHRKEANRGKTLELKDILSILCNAENNGVNIFNVGNLTIYQMYEHFERVNVKENHKRTLALWANTYSLKENQKVPDWIVKTKL